MTPSAANSHYPDTVNLDALLQKCIHCGMCLSACPTYSVFGTEMDNPRGRIALLRGISGGRIEPTDAFTQHIDRCLGCLACAVICPSGVRYAQLLEAAHAVALEARPRGPVERFIRWLGMRQLMPHVGRLRFLALLVTLYQASGLQWLIRRSNLLPANLRYAEALLPPKPFKPRTRAYNPPGRSASRGRVGLFIGCVQEAFLANVNQATIRVLERNGYEVVIPLRQTCCGALQLHEGEHELTTELAKQNIDAFLEANVDAIVVNAGGCEPVLKEYPELLRNDADYAAQAGAFGARLRDVSEFLVEQGVDLPRGRLAVRATYADSCHLRNSQAVIHQPRYLIRSIPGLEYVELEHPDQCCGSAGIYNILHPEIAGQLLDAKVADIAATGADVVVIANPGCHMQIVSGLRRAGLGARVVHLVELLDEAYAAERMDAPC